MAEAIALAASIIAVVQLADRIASVCKSLIETVEDYPRDLRLIFVETGSLKVIFESLHFLNEDDPADSATLRRLRGSNGPVEGCKTAMDELNQLFPTLPLPGSKRRGTKRQKLQNVLTSLAWPRKAEKARRLLDEIMRHKATINIALQGQLLTEFRNMKHELDEVHVTLNVSERRKVYEWFQDTNPSSSHNAANGLYEDSTGDWVFKAPGWDDWINARIRSLWVHGIPGAGKTVLAAHIIETTLRICEAKDKRTTCVYYYCYHGHNQDESVPFLRWLVSQILREADTVPILAWKAYTRNRESDTTILLDILHEVLDFFDLVYVAIDALDESQSRENLLSILEVLVTDPRFWKIQLLATSREYSDIELKMGHFSQSLSMSNCFVEADIRTYIAAKITAESKFQRWPSDLRIEVEATLSAGAKGMFRWAVCQLDILRRLNHQSKIREAIKNLPETLDETYERVFSYIADEEKEFVRHTLHWVCLHDFIWKDSVSLPAYVLIDAYIALEKIKSRLSSDEYLFDLETLKDSCGCLISFTFSNEDQSHSANIAHYTVREFLESNRSSFTSWFSIKQKDSYRLILAFILEYAITSDPIENLEYRDDGLPLDQVNFSNLREYCLATSVRSLRDVEELIEPRLAFRFLDPLEAHFEAIQTAVSILDSRFGVLSLAHGYTGFWDVNWHESTKNSKAATLANLLLMRCFGLAKDFIQLQDIESIFQETLIGTINTTFIFINFAASGRVEFECNLIGFFAESRALDKDVLNFFQWEASGPVCYADLLPHYMPEHGCIGITTCEGTCILPRLLQLGANPDPKGFKVTPLQMAIYNRDLAGARLLLEAGADSNNTGDEQGIKQHAERSILGSYCRLHGLAPLYILRHLKVHPYITSTRITEGVYELNSALTTDIEHLLLEYNASTGIYGE